MRADVPVRRPRSLFRSIVMASFAVMVSLVGVVPAGASSDRVSKGQAEAVLQAFGGAGWVILNHQKTMVGPPADSDLQSSIRPFSGDLWDGRHFCVQDWHTILISGISSSGSSDPWSLQQARADLDPAVVTFTLDGGPLATNRTPIKRYLKDPSVEAYYFQQGTVLPPSALAVGTHTASFLVTFPNGDAFGDGITFYIDPSGTGACL